MNKANKNLCYIVFKMVEGHTYTATVHSAADLGNFLIRDGQGVECVLGIEDVRGSKYFHKGIRKILTYHCFYCCRAITTEERLAIVKEGK